MQENFKNQHTLSWSWPHFVPHSPKAFTSRATSRPPQIRSDSLFASLIEAQQICPRTTSLYLIMYTQACASETTSLCKSRHSRVCCMTKHAPSTSVREKSAMNDAVRKDKKLELLTSVWWQIDHFTKYARLQKYKKAAWYCKAKIQNRPNEIRCRMLLASKFSIHRASWIPYTGTRRQRTMRRILPTFWWIWKDKIQNWPSNWVMPTGVSYVSRLSCKCQSLGTFSVTESPNQRPKVSE